ncbi:VIT1/CCC1 transporter family protein [Candidatus Berkelbacteria bacterium]|nr:VIT1/CCC1 transporter family protein [Candidatus Berkelbacteria bacterium]
MESQNSFHFQQGRYIKDLVFGANDGLITTFAIVAGVAGADLPISVVLILGFANLFADGFSMAAGDYLGSRSELDFVQSERADLEKAILKTPSEAKKALSEYYYSQGFRDSVLTELTRIVSSHRRAWVEALARGRFRLPAEDGQPYKNAGAIFLAFILVGSLPLLPFILALPNAFLTSILVTTLTLFVLGALRTRVTRQDWFMSGLEMLAVGALAAGVAYAVGALLGSIA